ncbi:uncharacterized protein LOC144151912 isoform X4 [Haemaphysalis longicornis]
MSVTSRIPKAQLRAQHPRPNPQACFDLQKKEPALSVDLIKLARKSGQLNLTGRGMIDGSASDDERRYGSQGDGHSDKEKSHGADAGRAFYWSQTRRVQSTPLARYRQAFCRLYELRNCGVSVKAVLPAAPTADKKTAKAEKRSAKVDIILRAAARDQDPVAVLRKRVVKLEAEMRGLRSLTMERPASSFHQHLSRE